MSNLHPVSGHILDCTPSLVGTPHQRRLSRSRRTNVDNLYVYLPVHSELYGVPSGSASGKEIGVGSGLVLGTANERGPMHRDRFRVISPGNDSKEYME